MILYIQKIISILNRVAWSLASNNQDGWRSIKWQINAHIDPINSQDIQNKGRSFKSLKSIHSYCPSVDRTISYILQQSLLSKAL